MMHMGAVERPLPWAPVNDQQAESTYACGVCGALVRRSEVQLHADFHAAQIGELTTMRDFIAAKLGIPT